MLSAKGGFTLATLRGNFAWRHNFWVARSCSATTQWQLRQNYFGEFGKASHIFSKKAFGKCVVFGESH